MARYVTRIFTTEAELSALAPSWLHCLQQQERSHVEQHPAWVESEARRTGEDLLGQMVVGLYDGEQLVGVAPFLLRRYIWNCRLGYSKVARFPVCLADLCGESLVAPADIEAHRVLLDAVARATMPYEMILLESTPVGSPLWQLSGDREFVRDRFWVHRAAPVTTHRLVQMPGSFSAYLEQFSGKTRRVLGYKVRRLEKACDGRVRLERITRADQIASFLERACQVSQRSWQGASLGKVLEATDAHLAWCREHAQRGWLRSYLLCDGERPIAFVHGLQAADTYYYDHVGYDHAYAETRPGTALLYKLLQDLFEHQPPKWVDFRYGDSEYKKLFSNHAYEEQNLFLLRPSAYTAVARATHAACDVVGRAVRAGLDRLGMRERARQLLRARALGSQAAAPDAPMNQQAA